MLNKVIFQNALCIRSCRGNTVVNIDSQGHVVTNDGRNFKMNGVTQEVRIRSPLKLPIICEDEIKIKDPNIQEIKPSEMLLYNRHLPLEALVMETVA